MKIKSDTNFRYSLKDKTLNIEKRLIKTRRAELLIGTGLATVVATEYPENFTDDMIVVAETLNRSMPNIKVPEITWRECPATIPVFKVNPVRREIRFCVNMGTTRMEREMNDNMYAVIIKKWEPSMLYIDEV
jgi:hypothetical protein